MTLRHRAHAEALEPRRLLAGEFPLAVMANGKTLDGSAAQYAQAFGEMKTLGVDAVRYWAGFGWQEAASKYLQPGGQPAFNRLFDLHDRLGVQVAVSIVPHAANGVSNLPPSAAAVRDVVWSIANYRPFAGSARTLADVVDRWEVGNEVSLQYYYDYWAGASTDVLNQKARVEHYVDHLLLPAADVLVPMGEKVANAGLHNDGATSYPTSTDWLLDRVALRGRLADLSFISAHPYAVKDQVATYVAQLRAVVDAHYPPGQQPGGAPKPLIATEWSASDKTRYNNFTPLAGAQDLAANSGQWATDIDTIYPTLRGAFESAYFFALLNDEVVANHNGRHRPGGLLRYATATDHASAFVPSPLFYAMWEGWRDEATAVSGAFYDDADSDGARDAGEVGLAGRSLYLDFDADGLKDAEEPGAITSAGGSFAFSNYAPGPAGAHLVRELNAPTGWRFSDATVDSRAGRRLTGQTVGVTRRALVSGGAFVDLDLDGTRDANEGPAVAYVVYADLDRDGSRDPDEPADATDDSGAWQLPVPAGTTRVALASVGRALGVVRGPRGASVVAAAGQTLATGVVLAAPPTRAGGPLVIEPPTRGGTDGPFADGRTVASTVL